MPGSAAQQYSPLPAYRSENPEDLSKRPAPPEPSHKSPWKIFQPLPTQGDVVSNLSQIAIEDDCQALIPTAPADPGHHTLHIRLDPLAVPRQTIASAELCAEPSTG